MSHVIETATYDEKVNKKNVQKYWDEYAAHDDWQEGCCGLGSNIRWIDHICTDYNEANEYINSHDKGWYDQLAVKFYDYPNTDKHGATYNKIVEDIKKTRETLAKYEEAHSIATFKSAFIGCPTCGSKIHKDTLVKKFGNRNNACPVCRGELRGKTTIETIERYNAKIKELNKKLEDETKKENAKNIKKAKIKWLVKVEWHC